MYESSSFTFLYKYLFAPIWGGGLLAGFFLADNPENLSTNNFEPMLIMFVVVMIWLIVLAVRLRSATASGSHLTIRSVHGSEKIDYKNIQYVSEALFVNPRLITVKYFDPETGESDVIVIMPSTTSEMFRFKFMKEHDMTQYIREQIFIHNPQYSEDNEPSRWKISGLVVFTFAVAALMASGLAAWMG